MSSISQILDDLEIPYCKAEEHHHVRQGWIGLDCPWCPPSYGGKGKYRLGIEVSSGRVSCWVCGRHSLAEVLTQTSRVSMKAALSLLDGVKLEKYVPQGVKISGKLIKPKNVGPMTEPHRRYLKGRGFNPETIERLWNVQGIGLSKDLKWRLFIPIVLNGEEVSWTTRSIGTTAARYISASPEQERLHLKHTLYGIDLVRTTIIVMEGPTDVWKAGPSSTATFGLNYSPAQLSLMIRFPHRVVCFDNSSEAQRRADHLCDTLSMFEGRTTNVCLDAEDPGSADEREIRKLRKSFLGE